MKRQPRIGVMLKPFYLMQKKTLKSSEFIKGWRLITP